MIGLQAITEYSVETFSGDLDMVCDLKSEADGQFHESVHLVQKDAEVQRTVKNVSTFSNILLTVKCFPIQCFKELNVSNRKHQQGIVCFQ